MSLAGPCGALAVRGTPENQADKAQSRQHQRITIWLRHGSNRQQMTATIQGVVRPVQVSVARERGVVIDGSTASFIDNY